MSYKQMPLNLISMQVPQESIDKLVMNNFVTSFGLSLAIAGLVVPSIINKIIEDPSATEQGRHDDEKKLNFLKWCFGAVGLFLSVVSVLLIDAWHFWATGVAAVVIIGLSVWLFPTAFRHILSGGGNKNAGQDGLADKGKG